MIAVCPVCLLFISRTCLSNTYSIANNGTVTMFYDSYRGYVFNMNGGNYLQVSANTPANCTRTIWVKSSTRSVNSGNIFSSTFPGLTLSIHKCYLGNTFYDAYIYSAL